MTRKVVLEVEHESLQYLLFFVIMCAMYITVCRDIIILYCSVITHFGDALWEHLLVASPNSKYTDFLTAPDLNMWSVILWFCLYYIHKCRFHCNIVPFKNELVCYRSLKYKENKMLLCHPVCGCLSCSLTLQWFCHSKNQHGKLPKFLRKTQLVV